MSKPKFIFFLGASFSATTPLYKMLRNHITSGFAKEHHLAEVAEIAQQIRSGIYAPTDRDNFPFLSSSKKSSTSSWVGGEEYNEKLLRCKKKIDCAQNFGTSSGEIITDYPDFSNWSIQKYVDYYKKLWDNRGDGRDVLVDWSNSNGRLDYNFIKNLLEALKKEFDVSALIICRDPVRRAWSWLNYAWNDYSKVYMKDRYTNIDSAAKAEFAKIKPYHPLIESVEKSCPVHVLVMEKVWEGNSFLSKEESQIITQLIGKPDFAPNLYCPDRGNKAIRYKHQKDQWCSDHFNMSDKQYYEYKNIMIDHYDGWKGDLPEGWGSPMDYETNCSLPIDGIEEQYIKPGTYRKSDGKLYVDFDGYDELYNVEYVDPYFSDKFSNP